MSITTIHPDIIRTHILTRLDGSTLASAATASPALHHMCTEETLWMEICKSTWSSIDDPRVSSIISTFPAGYRSFYSDSFPTLHYKTNDHRRSPISELISAVDIKYRNIIVYSKVREMETANESPFRVELLEPKENVVGMPIKFEGDLDILYSHLKESMTLSWILIDPTRKRAANVSSWKPVLVQWHYMTGNVQLRYMSILAGGPLDFVECKIEVTCGIKEGGELIIKEVKFEVVDMDGECLSGEDSLVILKEAVLGGERRKGEERERERYEEYVEMKRERRDRIDKRRRSFYNFVLHSLVAFILFMITKTWVSFLLLVVALLLCIKQGLSPPPTTMLRTCPQLYQNYIN